MTGAASAPTNVAPARPRLAVVVSHPTQYYSPWFRWIAAHAPLAPRVFYLWNFGVAAQRDPGFAASFAWDVDLLSGYEHEFVPNTARAPGTDHFRGLVNPTLPARLDAWQPDALLLFGYHYATHLRTILWARRRRVPLVFRGDSHLLGRARPGLPRTIVLRALFRQFAAVTFVGRANRAYFERFGVPPEKLFFAPHAVNQAAFDPDAPAVRHAAAALRDQLGLSPATRVILFAGKFIAWKQPAELLHAFLDRPPPDTVLVLAGDGPEREALVATTARAALAGRVHFLPFANQSEMPARYALADVFVLPSRGNHETWGLAINEAMHMGVPCIASDRVGCQSDLVVEGVTGWVFPHDQRNALSAALHRAIAAVTADAAGWRERVRRHAAVYSYAYAADGLTQAVRAALASAAARGT